jgi:serine/threonine protein kinase
VHVISLEPEYAMTLVYGNRWEVVEARPLGEGGQAQTYLVRDRNGDPAERYALKRLKNVNRIERFELEIEAVKTLTHPHVLALVDYSLSLENGAKPYMVTEYCAGGNLASGDSTRWAEDPIGTLELFADVCDGVGAAHHREGGAIVHRDIKPENVLLRHEHGVAVVADFGIAYIQNGERERLTETQEAVGAYLFIAPEFADGRTSQVLPWSDVYSLGKLLFWMLNGGSVFDRERHRDDHWNLLLKNKNNDYEHINRLLDKMIVQDPHARFQTARVAAGAVRHVADLLRRGARAISPELRQQCDFCKQGEYETIVADALGYNNFVGTRQISGSDWRILVCDQCGHVQWFRIEKAKGRKNWWGA